MNPLKIIFIIILSILAAVMIMAAIFLKTLDINEYKLVIQSRLSESIGLPVEIGSLAFEVSPKEGVFLGIRQLIVGASFGESPLFETDTITLNVDVISLLTKKEVTVSHIKIIDPYARVIKSKDGRFNGSTPFGRSPLDPKESNHPEQASKSERVEGSSFDPKIPFKLFIRSIHIEGGSIIYTDQSTTPSIQIPLRRLDLDIDEFALDKAFRVALNASLFSEKPNISFKTTANVNSKEQTVQIEGLGLKFNLSDFSLEQIKESIPSVKEAGLSESLQGELSLNIDRLIAGQTGLIKLSGNGALNDMRIKLKDIPYPLENIDMRFSINERDVLIDEFFMYFASGKIFLNGKIEDYLNEQRGRFTFGMEDLNVRELASDAPVEIVGRVYGKFQGEVKGFTEESLKNSARAQGEIDVREARVVNVNVLKMILKQLSFIPNVVERVEANLPSKYKTILSQKDTVFNRVAVDAELAGEKLLIKKAQVETEGFSLQANGFIDIEQNMALELELAINQDLSKSFVNSVNELSFLLDSQNRLNFPFKPYRGKLVNFIIYPDVARLSQQIFETRGKQELKNAIFKAIGVEKQGSPEPTAEKPEPSAPKKAPAPEEVLIDKILDAIF